MTDIMIVALEEAAQKSARFWKKRLTLEADPAWKQIGMSIALEDCVSLAAGKLGYFCWDDTSWEIGGRRVDVGRQAWTALRKAMNETSLFTVGDRFVNNKGCRAHVVRVERFEGWERVTVAFPGHEVIGTEEFIAKTLARDGFEAVEA